MEASVLFNALIVSPLSEYKTLTVIRDITSPKIITPIIIHLYGISFVKILNISMHLSF